MNSINRKPPSGVPGSDPVRPWLGAYLDGEVTRALHEQIEAHLVNCPACQVELAGLQQLTNLLHADSDPIILPTSDAFFTRQVLERISQPVRPMWQRALKTGWYFAPMFLFAVWAFFQAVGWISGAVLFVLEWFPGASDALQVFGPLAWDPRASLLGGLLRMDIAGSLLFEGVERATWFSPAGVLFLLNLAVLGVLAVLFLSWLASWWAYHRIQKAVN